MIQLEKVRYTAKAHTVGGRDGASRSDDGLLDIELSSLGTPGTGTNPGQLFAAGWPACFRSAIKIVAGKMKITLPADRAIEAGVDLGTTHGVYGLAARLNVSLPGMERQAARALADAAHHVCPYSHATRGNIYVAINVVTGAVTSEGINRTNSRKLDLYKETLMNVQRGISSFVGITLLYASASSAQHVKTDYDRSTDFS